MVDGAVRKDMTVSSRYSSDALYTAPSFSLNSMTFCRVVDIRRRAERVEVEILSTAVDVSPLA